MRSDGVQETNGPSDIQLKLIGFLLACALGILGWGFNNWSSAVENGMEQVMVKLNKMESRAESRDERITDIALELRVLSERQAIIRKGLERQEKHNHD